MCLDIADSDSSLVCFEKLMTLKTGGVPLATTLKGTIVYLATYCIPIRHYAGAG
jgi:hypothetical protein